MTNVTPVTETPVKGLLLGDTIYMRMKFVVQILLPALSTLYFTLGAIWNLPAVEQVIGTMAALTTFLGVILGLSSKTYNASDARFDGLIAIEETDTGAKRYSLELNGDPNDLDGKKSVTFRIDSSG